MILSPPPLARFENMTNEELVELIFESRRVIQIMNNPDNNEEIKEKWKIYNECLE
jgi:hypothetical protein